ncbi:MAG: hypothetical protein U0L74_01140 [Paludibacteraceae bacterium]|nr:hypothetical protein [Paludibacteraceae bacterium]
MRKALEKILIKLLKILAIVNFFINPICFYFELYDSLIFLSGADIAFLVYFLCLCISCVFVLILICLDRVNPLWIIYLFVCLESQLLIDWIGRKICDKPCVTVAFVSSKIGSKSSKYRYRTTYYYWFKDVDGKVIKGERNSSKKFHPKDTFLVVFNESDLYPHYSFKNAPTKEEIDKYIDGPKRISQEEYEKWREDYGFFD